MNNKININPSSTKWLEKDDWVVADYFCDLGFRSLKQILDMRVFDLMNMQSATKMRSVLRKLANIADRNKCAVILIGHMNKGGSSKSLYRGLGSIDIAAIARSVLMISRDESRPDIRYMYPIKSSLAPEGPAIAFSFKEHGGIVWHGKYDLNTAELMDSITVKTTKRERARAKLVQLLEHEDRPAKEVYAGLADIGVGSRTVEKAKKELQVTTYRSGGSWYWSLPKPK